jgi:hypothetical protein
MWSAGSSVRRSYPTDPASSDLWGNSSADRVRGEPPTVDRRETRPTVERSVPPPRDPSHHREIRPTAERSVPPPRRHVDPRGIGSVGKGRRGRPRRGSPCPGDTCIEV